MKVPHAIELTLHLTSPDNPPNTLAGSPLEWLVIVPATLQQTASLLYLILHLSPGFTPPRLVGASLVGARRFTSSITASERASSMDLFRPNCDRRSMRHVVYICPASSLSLSPTAVRYASSRNSAGNCAGSWGTASIITGPGCDMGYALETASQSMIPSMGSQ